MPHLKKRGCKVISMNNIKDISEGIDFLCRSLAYLNNYSEGKWTLNISVGLKEVSICFTEEGSIHPEEIKNVRFNSPPGERVVWGSMKYVEQLLQVTRDFKDGLFTIALEKGLIEELKRKEKN